MNIDESVDDELECVVVSGGNLVRSRFAVPPRRFRKIAHAVPHFCDHGVRRCGTAQLPSRHSLSAPQSLISGCCVPVASEKTREMASNRLCFFRLASVVLVPSLWWCVLLSFFSLSIFQVSSYTPLSFTNKRVDISLKAELSSFEEKRSFESRLAKIERNAASTLGGFYEPHLTSFSVKPGSVERLSITSTCFALQAILAGDDEVYDSLIQLDVSAPPQDGLVSAKSVLLALLDSDWRKDDLFQVPLLLSTVLKLDPKRKVLNAYLEEERAARLRLLIEKVLEARPRRRFGSVQTFSDYIQFLCTQAFVELYSSTQVPTRSSSFTADKSEQSVEIGIAGLPNKVVPDGAAGGVTLALARSVEVSQNELCRQLAFRSSGDYYSFDVMRLAYSLLTYVTATNTLSGTAGIEIVPGQGPEPGSRVDVLNQKLVAAALRAFFEEQLDNGLWDKGQPIYKSFRKQGRNVGNAFVFALDTLGSLLSVLPAESFRPYLKQLENSLVWIESHQTVEVIADYCDAESGQCYGRPLRGWSSPHLSPDSSPQAWCTAQALVCVSLMRRQTRYLMNQDVLNEFNGVLYSNDGPVNSSWDRLLDSDLGDCGNGRCRTLKDVLSERVIDPFEKMSQGSPSFGAAFSAILFGPPGTAKTTICESLARKMGWDFCVIDTSVFLADGLGNVASRIRYVFERLQVLDRCVILFDEIEEFCLDRETPGIGMESRMLTTAMLTAINDLRRAKRSVFFLATNRLRAFDSAITRPGRFDMQLFVGTPNLEARCTLFRQQLSTIGSVDEGVKTAALASYREFLSSVWTETAMFMNYLESLQFAKACADVVASESSLEEEVMSSLLDMQKAVMTVRGSVRDEFLASMGLSRL